MNKQKKMVLYMSAKEKTCRLLLMYRAGGMFFMHPIFTDFLYLDRYVKTIFTG